ncbi:hypothetical protein THALO_350174 [Tenacibaculum halocynthiae]
MMKLFYFFTFNTSNVSDYVKKEKNKKFTLILFYIISSLFIFFISDNCLHFNH